MQYNLLVENVRTVLTQRMDHIHVALQSLSQALSAHGQWQQQQQQQLQDNLTTDSSVPWVTLPDWELRAGAIRLQTGLKLVVYAPLVPLVVVSDPNGTVPFQNHDWNMYSATMAPEWMATSHSVLWDEPLDQNDTDITPFVFEFSSSSSSRLPLRPATTTWSPPTGNASHPVQWLLPMWQVRIGQQHLGDFLSHSWVVSLMLLVPGLHSHSSISHASGSSLALFTLYQTTLFRILRRQSSTVYIL